MSNIKLPRNKNKTKKTKFQGDAFFNFIVLYFLSHKHDNVCSILSETYETDKGKSPNWYDTKPLDSSRKYKHVHDESCVLLPKKLNHLPKEQTDISLRWIEEKNLNDSYIQVPEPTEIFWKKFKKCKNKRFIILPFGFTCRTSGHANYLLYDKKKRTL